MEKQKFELMKVFDCQTMPKDVRKKFFEDSSAGNDCYVNLDVHESVKLVEIITKNNGWFNEDNLSPITDGEILYEDIDEGIRRIIQRGDDIVSDWLFDNGAEIGEKVLIKHWW